MPDLYKIKRNVAKMASMQAPPEEIDSYLSQEGVSAEDIQSIPLAEAIAASQTQVSPQGEVSTASQMPQQAQPMPSLLPGQLEALRQAGIPESEANRYMFAQKTFKGLPINAYTVKAKPAMKEPTVKEKQALKQVSSMYKDLEELSGMVKKDQQDYKKGKNVGGLTSYQMLGTKPLLYISEKGQDYRLLRENISNRLVYLRSGAAINESEFKRLDNLLPKAWRSDKVDLKQLERFKSEYGEISSRPEVKELLSKYDKEDKYVRTGTRNGQRVGMLADGTIEVINGEE